MSHVPLLCFNCYKHIDWVVQILAYMRGSWATISTAAYGLWKGISLQKCRTPPLSQKENLTCNMKSRIMVISALFNKPSRETVMKPRGYRLAHMRLLCLDMRTGYAHYSSFLCNSFSPVQLGMSWHRIEGHTVADPSTCVPMCKQVARLSMKSATASPCFKPTANCLK